MKYIVVLFLGIGSESTQFEMDTKYNSWFECAYFGMEYQSRLNQTLEAVDVSNWATSWTCKIDN